MAQQISTNEFKIGAKIEVDGQPYTIVTNEFCKPGKGQPFNRVRLKHLMTQRVIERTFKSGEKVDLADVQELSMRLLYVEADGAVLMDESTFEQVTVANEAIGDSKQWLKEDELYTVIFYNGQPITLEPPTFMELEVAETAPGIRGDTTGRVMKAAVLSTGAKVQVPIFIDEKEIVRFDTRTNEYVGRVNK